MGTTIKTEVWVAWIGATVAAAVTMMFVMLTFAYGQFETKEHASERADANTKRLERIENKIDALGGFDQQQQRSPGSRGR